MLLVSALLIAASAAGPASGDAMDPRVERILLAVNAEAAAPGPDVSPPTPTSKIDHTPLDKTARGEWVTIKAKVEDPSSIFAPLVFARRTGSKRYEAFTMRDRGRRGFSAKLPPSILNEGSFEYFIEAQHDEGGATRLGSPKQPFNCVAYDPPPVPVPTTFTSGDVAGATVKIDGDDIGKTPLTVNLGPGTHVISVTAADGRSTEQQIDVKQTKKLAVNIPLPSLAGGPASLGVQSDPPNANVIVDGAVIGHTPFQGELAPGQHTVAVEMDGRMRQERQITTKEGRDAQLSFALPPLPKEPALTIESEPVGAIVAIDGKDKGRTPFVGAPGSGHHQVVLHMDGRREVGTDFTMPKDHDLSLRLELPIAAGAGSHLTITSAPIGANVAIDGKEIGITPWSGEMKAGNHKVLITSNGYLKEERIIPVQNNRDADVTFALNREPGPGKLHIETEPAESIVSIDGQQVGTAPYNGDVAPGEHQLDVSNEGFKTIAQQINLEAGQQLSLKLALQQATAGQVPPLIAVASDPQGAMLFLDGKQIGPTPIKARSVAGPHEIKLALDGYTTRIGKINLPDSRDFELRMAVSLKPVRGVEEKHEAPPALELARAQLKTAHACFRQGDWDCAQKGFQSAYEYKAVPELLYNIAQCRRRKGECKQALEAYKAFLKEAPDANPKLRSEATKYENYCQIALSGPAPTTTINNVSAVAAGETGPAAGAPPAAGNASVAATTPPAAGTPGAAGTAPATTPPSMTNTAAAASSTTPVNASSMVAANRPAPPAGAIALPTVSDEDTDPPVMVHETIKKVTRGQPLALRAHISDERSGVATPQACWRNLFRPEFECQPMGKIGEDEYGIEVPAKSVSDGFAYYLEAYDNSDNGPARSGAPELPNSVVIEEAPVKPPPAAVLAAATPVSTTLDPNNAPPGGNNLVNGGPPLPAQAKESNHLFTWISIGAAVAAVGSAGALELHASSADASLHDGQLRTHPEVDRINNQVKTEQLVANILFGVAGAFAIGAIAFWNF